MGSTMSFGRILANRQMNTLELGLQNVLTQNEQIYLESLVKSGIDLRKTITDRQMLERRYPTRRLFHSTLPTIVDVPELVPIFRSNIE